MKTPQEQLDRFFRVYDEAGPDQPAYATYLLDVTAEFAKSFGSLKSYVSADGRRVDRYFQIIRSRALAASKFEDLDEKIRAECIWAFIKFLATLDGKDIDNLEGDDLRNEAKISEIVFFGYHRNRSESGLENEKPADIHAIADRSRHFQTRSLKAS